MDIISFILARALDEGSDTPSASSVIYDPSTSVGLVSTDVQSAIDELSTRGGLKNEIVQSLPLTGEEGICYFVPNNSSEIENIYDEYIWFNLLNDYEKIGSTKVDISDLLKSEAITEPYDDTKTYDVGDYVTYLGYLYKCKTAVTTAQSFAPAKWDKIDIFTYIKNDGADYIANEKTYNALSTNNKTLTGAINEITGIVGSDNAPYVFRQTPFIASQENLKSIVGGSVAFNQLVNSIEGTSTTRADVNIVNNGTYISMSGTANANDSGFNIISFSALKDHIYLSKIGGKNGEITENVSYLHKSALITKPTSDVILRYKIWLTNGVTYSGNYYINLIDLTQMFGSTIADYIYSLETSQAGSGIAWLKKYGYFTKPYYAYSDNTMQSVNVSAHNTVGFNAYDNSTGKAKLVGGKEYQITGTYTALSYSTGETITPDSNGKFTPTLDGELTVTGGNATNTCVHLVLDGSRDGEYEPYKKNSYDLSGSHEVQRKYAEVDLGNLNWNYNSTGNFFYSNSLTDAKTTSINSVANIICDTYITKKATGYNEGIDKAISIGALIFQGYGVNITDSAYTDANAFKTAVTGKKLVYEKATPTTETVTNPTLRGILKLDANNNLYYDGDSFSDFQNLQIVDDFGTEEFVDAEESAGNRDVAIPVGHNTDYFNSSILAYNIDYTDDKIKIISDNVMYKGIDYVTAGQKMGSILGTKATAEGNETEATGDCAHVEGNYTTATGKNSHAQGNYTIAASDDQHVEGHYNISDTNNIYAHIIGGGTSTIRKNIFTVDWDGNTTANNFITSTANLNTLNTRVTNIEDQLNYYGEGVYGIQIDYENNTTTRLAGAEGKNAGTDFDNFAPFKRKRCVLADNGVVVAYAGETGYVEDGSAGQVMVEQPKFYYKVVPLKLEPQTDGKGYHIRKANYYVSEFPYIGFKLHPAFIDGNGKEADYYYIGAYEGSLYDVSADAYLLNDEQVLDASADKLSSISGAKPVCGQTQNLTRVTADAAAHNRGNGWHGLSVKIAMAETLLILIEYGDNIQSKLGKGVVDISDDSNYNCSSLTGSTSSLGVVSGSASSTVNTKGETSTTETANGKVSISYRGVENFWGNIWKFLNGINLWGDGTLKGGEVFVCKDFNYAESKKTDNYESAGFTATNVNGYISAFGYGNADYDWLFVASECLGNSSLPIGDYTYVTANLNGYRIARLGGSWRDGWSAGPCSLNLAYSPGYRYRRIGARVVWVLST